MATRQATGGSTGSILALMTRVLAHVFSNDSWATWRLLLRAAFESHIPLSERDRDAVRGLTGRNVLPTSLKELWLIVGRRAGKSMISALIAVWATCCRSYTMAPGEVGVFIVIAADRMQARVVKRYISGLLRCVPVLAAMIARETKDAIWLTNGLCIEIHTCSYRSLRGYTCVGAICDEIAFWDDEDSANPDHEVLVALRAAMATVPEALLVALTSPYARKGEAWKTYQKHWGNNDSNRVLVVNAPTRVLNPTVAQDVIDAAYEDDPAAAAAEFGGEWRRDVEIFLPIEALEAVRVPQRLELPYSESRRGRYVAFIDPAGGTGQDSMTMAIAHIESNRAVLDLVREVRPPFSPEVVVNDFATDLKRYGVVEAQADRYAGSWPTEQFRKAGITVTPSDRTRSEIYLAALPAIVSGQVELLDHSRLLKQLGSLERRTSRQGRDTVDAPPRLHEDVANAACGALVLASTNDHPTIEVVRLLGF